MAEKGTRKETIALIALILFVSCGLLVLTVIIVLAKRQIMRISLRSKSGRHVPVCQDAPTKMKTEVRRRLHRTEEIQHEPILLPNDLNQDTYSPIDYGLVWEALKMSLRSDRGSVENENEKLQKSVKGDRQIRPNEYQPHLYRMKSLDACRLLEQHIHRDYRIYPNPDESFAQLMIRCSEKFSSINLRTPTILKFVQLYDHARYEPTMFGKTEYNEMLRYVAEIRNKMQGAHQSASAHYRPIADIDEITDTVLERQNPGFSHRVSNVMVSMAAKLLKRKNKQKSEYQSVPSTESLDNDETVEL